jgi:hypothetical protein
MSSSSTHPLRRTFPISEETETLITLSLWPSKAISVSPVFVSHILIVLGLNSIQMKQGGERER